VWGLQEEEGREEGRVRTSCGLRRSFRRPRAPRQTTGRRTVPVGLAVIVVRAGRPDARRSGSGYDDFAVRARLGAGACPARRYWAARRTSIARRWGTRYGGIRSSACDSRANACPLCRYGGKSDVRSGAGYGEGFPRCSCRLALLYVEGDAYWCEHRHLWGPQHSSARTRCSGFAKFPGLLAIPDKYFQCRTSQAAEISLHLVHGYRRSSNAKRRP
ncbi:hypothetical protein B0H16DRAFT_1900605, partial [Mycena metata]